MNILCKMNIHSFIPYSFNWNKDHEQNVYFESKKKAWTGEFFIKELICQRCGKKKLIPKYEGK